MRILLRTILLVALLLPVASRLTGQLPPATAEQIDAVAAQALHDSPTPSVSIAVVQQGQIAYVKAYGNARLDPSVPARPEMRYAIGSVSKQFLAGAILLLAEEGKLSLEDRVARFLPALTRAQDITIRQLLSHTAGYQAYYPLDYVAPFMLKTVTPDGILDRWAKIALDFEPGAQWQYSNTNYAVAGRIVEKVSGVPLMTFLAQRIFGPLGMKSPINLAEQPPIETDAAGYLRFGMGPLHPAPPEAPGWLFAAGELAMTARDLALWDQSLLEKRLLQPASLHEMITPVSLKNGAPTNYALGVSVTNDAGHPKVSHGGAVSGFVSHNAIWLDEGAAVVVLTNMDASPAASSLANKIAPLLLAPQRDPQGAAQFEVARRAFNGLQQGTIDRSLLSPDADAYFTSQALADISAGLKPLGIVASFEQVHFGLRGGMTARTFQIRFSSGKSLDLSTFFTADSKLAQCLVVH